MNSTRNHNTRTILRRCLCPLIQHSMVTDSAKPECKNPLLNVQIPGFSLAVGVTIPYLAPQDHSLLKSSSPRVTRPLSLIQRPAILTSLIPRQLFSVDGRSRSKRREARPIRSSIRTCNSLPKVTFLRFVFRGGCPPDKQKRFTRGL